MKANKITNSINILLNEDKFSKYTLNQIFDELGEEDFLNYLAKICSKVINSLDPKRNFGRIVPVLSNSYASLDIIYQFPRTEEAFNIAWWGEEDGVSIHYDIGNQTDPGESIFPNDINVPLLLKEKITKVYYSSVSIKYRKKNKIT